MALPHPPADALALRGTEHLRLLQLDAGPAGRARARAGEGYCAPQPAAAAFWLLVAILEVAFRPGGYARPRAGGGSAETLLRRVPHTASCVKRRASHAASKTPHCRHPSLSTSWCRVRQRAA